MPHLRPTEDRVFAGLFPALLLSAALAAGCEGEIGERSVEPGAHGGAAGSTPVAPGLPSPAQTEAQKAADAQMRAANPTLFETAAKYFPEEAGASAPKRLFRLTRTQLDTTAKSLLPSHWKAPIGDTMPRDPLQTNYEYAANLGWNAANFTPYTQWVQAIATSVRATPNSVIDCTSTSDAACLEDRAKKFVTRAFRGITDAAMLDRFAKFYLASVSEVGFPDATADLVDLTLTSPQFVFRDEVQTNGNLLAPAHQLQNLSYTLADAPPDALGLPLTDAAAHVGSPDAVQRTIDKLLATPQAREKLLRFFISWLEVKEPDEFGIAADVFPEFTPAVAQAAVDETRAFLNHQLASAAPKLKDVTQSSQSFVSEALEDIYDVNSASSTRPTQLDPKQRLGIFTQPAVIASHSGPVTTRLVKRGVFFTRKVMCLPLGLPPPGTNTTLPEVKNTTERKRVESATSGGVCAGCHTYINPFGFMQENYDAIGRWRTTDEGLPIDASIKIDFLDEGVLMTQTPVEALTAITKSMRFQQCFARQLFRFYTGRDEGPGDDPVLRQMFFGFANADQQDIVAMLQTLARSATFSQRSEAR